MSDAGALRGLVGILTRPGHYEGPVDDAAKFLAQTLQVACLVALLAPNGEQMHGIALHHHEERMDELLEEMLGEPFEIPPLARVALGSGETLVVPRATPEQMNAAPGAYQSFFQAIDASSFVGVPLSAPLQRIGIVTVVRSADEEPLSGGDVQLIEAAAALIALRVEYGYLADALEPRKAPVEADEVLTAREREILGLLRKGHTNREVANQLYLSVRTVEWHRAQIQWKLGARSRAELFKAADSLGLA
jgi:DNA-binding CsgD family transcriptional regulator